MSFTGKWHVRCSSTSSPNSACTVAPILSHRDSSLKALLQVSVTNVGRKACPMSCDRGARCHDQHDVLRMCSNANRRSRRCVRALYLNSLQQVVNAFLCLGREELEGHSGLALSIGLLDALNDAHHATNTVLFSVQIRSVVVAFVLVFAK
jgi:hypothetical protein